MTLTGIVFSHYRLAAVYTSTAADIKRTILRMLEVPVRIFSAYLTIVIPPFVCKGYTVFMSFRMSVCRSVTFWFLSLGCIISITY